jgi:hypothetical protein
MFHKYILQLQCVFLFLALLIFLNVCLVFLVVLYLLLFSHELFWMLNYSHSRNPSCARTDARTNPSAQRATQLWSVLARVYYVSIQNLNTTTVP